MVESIVDWRILFPAGDAAYGLGGPSDALLQLLGELPLPSLLDPPRAPRPVLLAQDSFENLSRTAFGKTLHKLH